MGRLAVNDRRELLLDAALAVIARLGVTGATTRAIVAEAGVSLASFHYAFESRDQLIAELVSRVIQGEEAVLSGVPPGGVSMRDTIRHGLMQYFEVVKADPLREKAMFELTQYAMRSPELEPLARAQYDRYYALAESALDVAARSTGLSWARPTAELATFLVVITDGLTLSWLVNRDDAAALAIIDLAADSLGALAGAA
ncbi:TetR family transcriptional regulator [Subtercola sp. PAMC28395]|uniref:TetR/AcrR family transcriptional regulator n=1 Tax=Subtercola sp. PAMC28395 TaxID=2846775 RepID=UPI001C0D9E67|nr:TetR family transcriptional regulator C-terminal domain-containing protein [Subtercola sp. PAMC28395]QWT23754.1 TetR family transcriptional regulator [Subtercola sp. PAMC28395]